MVNAGNIENILNVIRLNASNVHEYSLDVANIYGDGYCFNPKTGKGFYPHNFVYHAKEIEKAVINHQLSVLWDYIMLNNKPLASLMGYIEEHGLEIKALIMPKDVRGTKEYVLPFGNYLSDNVLGYLNNPDIHRVIAEPITFSPSVLAYSAATDAFPIGYAPWHILIQTPKFKYKEFKGDLDACMFDREHYYRNRGITSEDTRPKRKGNNVSLAEVFPLVGMVSSFAGIIPPKIKRAPEANKIKGNIQVFEAQPIDALFCQTKQAFRSESNDWAFAHKNINDNSSSLDFSNCNNNSVFESMLETILKANKNTRMLQASIPQTEDNLYKQLVLLENRFRPIFFIPGGAENGIDSVSYSRHKKINILDKIISNKILKYHDEYLYKSLERGYLAKFEGYDEELYGKNINNHIAVRKTVMHLWNNISVNA